MRVLFKSGYYSRAGTNQACTVSIFYLYVPFASFGPNPRLYVLFALHVLLLSLIMISSKELNR